MKNRPKVRTIIRHYLLPALSAIALPTAAKADWHEASSNHFVIYGDDNPKNLQRFAEQLESYQAAMAGVSRLDNAVPSPSNRVTIYLLGTDKAVQRIAGGTVANTKFLQGFYIPRAGGSVAFAPNVSASHSTQISESMNTLLHEYAHHFLISNSQFAMPRWFSEGAAEFYASASFGKDGSVGIGRPAQNRAGELFYARDVPVDLLIDADAYEQKRGNSTGYDAYYGKAWLLYHYLTFDEGRKGQLLRYRSLITTGKSSRDAGVEAFGDLARLERELESYMNKRMMPSLMLKGGFLAPGPVQVRKLSLGEAAILPVMIRSRRGVDADEAKLVVAEARTIAAKFPGDAAVLTALSEAEFDSHNEDAAIKAADAALAIDANRVNALVQKGYALFRKAESSGKADDFKAARATFVRLNKLENDHPIPLIYYYRSFAAQGQKPNLLAVKGLERAAEVAPYDLGLRMNLAMQLLRDGRSVDARPHLAAVAYNPHGGSLADRARQALFTAEKDPNWRGDMGVADGVSFD